MIPTADGGKFELAFHVAWLGVAKQLTELLLVWDGDPAIQRFADWIGVLNLFIHGVSLASFDRSCQPAFQAVSDAIVGTDQTNGLLGLLRSFRDLTAAERAAPEVKEHYRLSLESALRELLTGPLRTLALQTAGADAERAQEAVEAIRSQIRQGSDAKADQADVGHDRVITLKVFQSTATREVSIAANTRVGGLRKWLLDDGFPEGFKLLGRTGGTVLMTLKSTDRIPEDDIVLLHGVESLHPPKPLPPVAETRSRAELAWAYRGVIPRITNKQALEMCKELAAGFRDPKFQEQLRALQSEVRGEHRRTLADLALTVQKNVLPKYGYEGTAEGVAALRLETKEQFSTDAALHLMSREINDLLGFKEDMRESEAELLESPRFEVHDVKGWLEHLAEHGFVVVAATAADEDLSYAWELLWDFIESADQTGRVKRDDVNSWQDSEKKNCGWPAGKEDGIIHERGIGQSELLWYLRSLPSVRKIFSSIWQTEELVTSFDGAGVFRPYGRNESWKTKKKNWHHVDQAHTKRGLHCIQGQITLTDVHEGSGGLVVVPGSHKFHNEILRSYEHSTWDFLSLRKGDPIVHDGTGGPKLLAAKAGDCLLWDSRTIHSNTLPLKDHPCLWGRQLIRATVYVCMTPAFWCSAETLEKRQQAFAAGVTTAHWPHEYHEMDRPEKVARGTFHLTGEQLDLLAPSPWGMQDSSGGRGLIPGLPSFMPIQRFKVLAEDVAVLRVPSTTRRVPVGRLLQGDVVLGYVFGSWVHLAPEHPGAAAEEDRWVQWKDRSVHFLVPEW